MTGPAAPPPRRVRHALVEVAAPERVAVTAGETTSVPVEVLNVSGEPLELAVRVVGADGGPPVLTGPLAPGATAVGSVPVAMPYGFPGREQSAAVEVTVVRAGTRGGAGAASDGWPGPGGGAGGATGWTGSDGSARPAPAGADDVLARVLAPVVL
ncbi:MAG: hypothetical protein AB7L84_16685, partial [Acidimicrobiia bacterium]